VNGKRVDIPSYSVSPGEEISLVEKMRKSSAVQESLERTEKSGRVAWLEYNAENFTGKLITVPERQDIPVDIQEQLIVELYSK